MMRAKTKALRMFSRDYEIDQTSTTLFIRFEHQNGEIDIEERRRTGDIDIRARYWRDVYKSDVPTDAETFFSDDVDEAVDEALKWLKKKF
jgi:hypothetical protein